MRLLAGFDASRFAQGLPASRFAQGLPASRFAQGFGVSRFAQGVPRGTRLALGALAGVLMALMTGARALAQEAVAEPAVGESVAGYGVSDWLNLVLRLGLVLIVIWVSIMAMRWWVRRMNGATGGGSGRLLEVLESRSLGPNRSLQLVKLGNRAVLLGVTSDRINAVLEVTDPIEVERLSTPVMTEEPTSFRDAISRLGALTRRGAAPADGVTMQQPPVAATSLPARRQAVMQTNQTVGAGGAQQAGAVPMQSASAGVVQNAGGGVLGNRWLMLARWVIGLEDSPRGRLRPAASGAAAAMARAPIMGDPGARSAAAAVGSGTGMTPAERATRAAELPASRASRARSGYRQNKIAEAQRAITTMQQERHVS